MHMHIEELVLRKAYLLRLLWVHYPTFETVRGKGETETAQYLRVFTAEEEETEMFKLLVGINGSCPALDTGSQAFLRTRPEFASLLSGDPTQTAFSILNSDQGIYSSFAEGHMRPVEVCTQFGVPIPYDIVSFITTAFTKQEV